LKAVPRVAHRGDAGQWHIQSGAVKGAGLEASPCLQHRALRATRRGSPQGALALALTSRAQIWLWPFLTSPQLLPAKELTWASAG